MSCLGNGMRFVPFPLSHPFTKSSPIQAWKNKWWFVNHPFKAFVFLGDRTRSFQTFSGLEMALSHFYESRGFLRNVLRLLVDAILDLLHCNVFRTVSLPFCLSFRCCWIFFSGECNVCVFLVRGTGIYMI